MSTQFQTIDNSSRPMLLIVDDVDRIRFLSSQILTPLDLRIIEATDGVDAIAKYVQYRPKVVLLDISMPELDGLMTLKVIRRIDPDARIAMLTAQGQRDKVVAAMQAGAKDFIIKPFEPMRLLTGVQSLLMSD